MAKKLSKTQRKIKAVMGEFKAGTLHSGKGGPVVTRRDQAEAIAISVAKRAARKRRR